MPENYIEYISKMTKALSYYSQAYSKKKWLSVKAKVLEAEAQEILIGESERIEKTCARISKYMGFQVRADQCSVVEFYSYIALMASDR